MVSRVPHVFDEQGAMTDKAVEEQLRLRHKNALS
jgi:hypothetical protein